jgi:3-oxoacyl-(acyl-carrier-protein) synthase
MRQPCALTGSGIVSTAGDTAAAVFDRLLEGERLAADLQPSTAEGPEADSFPAATIAGFEPRRYVERKGFKLLSRTSQLACAAASLVEGELKELPAGKVGVVFGSAWASLDSVVRFEREAHVDGPRFVDPILFTETVANVPAGHVSICFGWSAINATISAGSASGLEALREATAFLEEGRADVIVAGGGDELNRHLLNTLHAERLTSDSPTPQPFTDRGRGTVGSEGACVFTLESPSHAAARGTRILGRLIGGVGGFVRAGSGTAAARRSEMLARLLEEAGWTPADVDLLVLSGNGTPARDRAEAAVVEEVFGSAGTPALAPKAVLGETWAAGGPLGVAVALESMRRSLIPPSPLELRRLGLSERPIERAVRHAVVIDCSESGQFSALAVAAGEGT